MKLVIPHPCVARNTRAGSKWSRASPALRFPVCDHAPVLFPKHVEKQADLFGL
jgi:hypothetical protein